MYRPRRPAATLLHRVVREHLETCLATAAGNDEHGRGVPPHVEAALREYLKCGILAHGFARVYCANCQDGFPVAFSCKGRDLCPSGATRRMAEVSAHLVDQVLPRVQHRPWVLSMPRGVRWHLRHKPEVISRLLTLFLREIETTIRQRSPGASPAARFGAAAFVHRFGSVLNSHVHFHVLVSDGVFSAGTDGEAVFLPALDLTRADLAAVRVGTIARAAEGRLRRRNSHDVVILAPVRHNRVSLHRRPHQATRSAARPAAAHPAGVL